MASGTPITLDKPRVLRFTIDAVAELESALGVGLDELWQRKQRIVALVALLHHGLQHEDPTLSEKRVRKILQGVVDAGGDLTEINERVLEALFESGVYGRQMVKKVAEVRAEQAEDAPTPDPPQTPTDDA